MGTNGDIRHCHRHAQDMAGVVIWDVQDMFLRRQLSDIVMAMLKQIGFSTGGFWDRDQRYRNRACAF